MINEKWAAIASFEGFYEVSDMGQVRSLTRFVGVGSGRGGRRREFGQLISLKSDRDGYRCVDLSRDGTKRSCKVHHLVLVAFSGPRPDGMIARHLNGNPSDNRVENLVWGTHSENAADTLAHGTHKEAGKTHCKNDHEFTPENTYRFRNRRICRACNRASAARLRGKAVPA